jgi:hypothetical protein
MRGQPPEAISGAEPAQLAGGAAIPARSPLSSAIRTLPHLQIHRMKRVLPTVLFLVVTATGLQSQTTPIRGVGRVTVETEPAEPPFGEPFDILLTLRLRPGVDVFLPDTLSTAPAAESYARGSWQTSPAGGDSLEVIARYPAIGYGEGRILLPGLDMWVAIASDGTGGVRSAGALATGLPADALRSIQLGTIEIGRYAAMSDSTEMSPRPAAGVLGARWNLWLVLAIGLVSMAGVGGAGVLVSRWRNRLARVLGRRSHRSPREEALSELQRLLSLGWHLDGKVDEFYASSTDVLREFAQRLDPSWPTSLTSSELVAKLQERWNGAFTSDLGPTISMAENVKFGGDRPDAGAAEADWQRIHSWIRSVPEQP